MEYFKTRFFVDTVYTRKQFKEIYSFKNIVYCSFVNKYSKQFACIQIYFFIFLIASSGYSDFN